MKQYPEVIEHLRGLALFNEKFATCIEAGIALVRCLHIIVQESQPEWADVVAKVQANVEDGHTLSHSMQLQSEYFPPLYVKMVRAGEVGGVLDETLRRTARLLEKEYQLRRRQKLETLGSLFLPQHLSVQEWSALTSYQRSALLFLFCDALGVMLSSGVPASWALDVVAELLPPAQRDKLQIPAPNAKFLWADVLASPGCLPPFVIELGRIGDISGEIDLMMEKAARYYEREIELLSL